MFYIFCEISRFSDCWRRITILYLLTHDRRSRPETGYQISTVSCSRWNSTVQRSWRRFIADKMYSKHTEIQEFTFISKTTNIFYRGWTGCHPATLVRLHRHVSRRSHLQCLYSDQAREVGNCKLNLFVQAVVYWCQYKTVLISIVAFDYNEQM